MITYAATYNLGDGPDKAKQADIARLAQAGASVIGFQEGGDRRGLRLPPGWRAFAANDPGAQSVPIAWDTALWDLEGWRWVETNPRTWVGSHGAGPQWAKPKGVGIVRLRGPDDRLRRFLCTHFIPSAERRGLPRAELVARRRHYRRQAAGLSRLILPRPRMGRTVVLGDFNAEHDSPLLRDVRRTGIGGWSDVPTHHGRAIDQVLGLGGPHRALHLSSDHRALLAPIRLGDT